MDASDRGSGAQRGSEHLRRRTADENCLHRKRVERVARYTCGRRQIVKNAQLACTPPPLVGREAADAAGGADAVGLLLQRQQRILLRSQTSIRLAATLRRTTLPRREETHLRGERTRLRPSYSTGARRRHEAAAGPRGIARMHALSQRGVSDWRGGWRGSR